MTALTVEQVRNMSLSECMAESKTRYEKAAAIEAKHPNGVTPDAGDDFTQVKELLTDIDLIETRTSELEEAGNRKQRILENNKKRSKPAERHQQPDGDDGGDYQNAIQMFGAQFVDAQEYKAVVESGALNNPRSKTPLSVQLKGSLLDVLTRKALVYSGTGVGGPLIQPDRQSGFLEILQRQLNLLDLLPTSRTTSNSIEYVKEKTFTNNAATVAEATVTTGVTGLKPESVLEFEEASSPVRTIAHWIPVTNQMLADAPAIRGVIDARLMYGLNQELEDQILSGGGTGSDLTGILASGITSLGLSAGSTYGGAANAVDALFAAMLTVSVTGLASPNGVVMHPVDWAAIRLMRETAATGAGGYPGPYLYGPPSVSGPMTLWGRPVVLSLGMTANTALVGDFGLGCMLFDRENGAIRVGTINDQFVRNMQTILAELRAAFVVWRTAAFVAVTGV